MMLLEKLAPNILSKPDEFLESCLQTLYMFFSPAELHL